MIIPRGSAVRTSGPGGRRRGSNHLSPEVRDGRYGLYRNPPSPTLQTGEYEVMSKGQGRHSLPPQGVTDTLQVPLQIADTPCLAFIDLDRGIVSRVITLEDGRPITRTPEMIRDILNYILRSDR